MCVTSTSVRVPYKVHSLHITFAAARHDLRVQESPKGKTCFQKGPIKSWEQLRPFVADQRAKSMLLAVQPPEQVDNVQEAQPERRNRYADVLVLGAGTGLAFLLLLAFGSIRVLRLCWRR